MPRLELRDYQYEALSNLRIGSILNGDTGSGKSLVSLAYYYTMNGGQVNSSRYIRMKAKPQDLYIITTAQKRDKLEWEKEMLNFMMSTDPKLTRYKHKIVIDSWNNIKKYVDVKDSFFIFDEQRVIGYGAWTKAFLKITRTNKNDWILLTATPGDTWSDYMPVFIANGFYRNKTEFERMHAVYSRFTKYPKIDRWINEGRLINLKKRLLISMKDTRNTKPHHEYVITEYDRLLYSKTASERWNPYLDRPIRNASEFCYTLRKIVNSDPSRVRAVKEILEKHPKAIIFYSYNYELDLLRKLFSEKYHISVTNDEKQEPIPNKKYDWIHLIDEKYALREWNGHKHEEIATESDYWVYLVEYLAGSEGWNCVETDTIIFYSQNYSYRITHQAEGRINRMNTPFIDLYYYHLRSNSKIDLAIRNAYNRKKKFNERGFAPVFVKKEDVNERTIN